MKKKLIDGSDMDWIEKYDSKVISTDEYFGGHISYVSFEKVKYRLTVDYDDIDTILLDNGYKGIIYLPENKTWCVSAVFNSNDEIVEWYFDMTKENSIDSNGKPYYLDLYLDVAVSPDLKITLLDEHELKEALELKVISKYDYDLAYETSEYIIKEIIPNSGFMNSFFKRHLSILGE